MLCNGSKSCNDTGTCSVLAWCQCSQVQPLRCRDSLLPQRTSGNLFHRKGNKLETKYFDFEGVLRWHKTSEVGVSKIHTNLFQLTNFKWLLFMCVLAICCACRIEFVVGAQEVRNFTMVERHFFRDICLKDFDITFPFCMPNSRNTCEYIYEMPELSPQQS